MRVVPEARRPPGGVWLAPRTLNELTVKCPGGSARRVVATDDDVAADTLRTPASAAVIRPLATRVARDNSAPMDCSEPPISGDSTSSGLSGIGVLYQVSIGSAGHRLDLRLA